MGNNKISYFIDYLVYNSSENHHSGVICWENVGVSYVFRCFLDFFINFWKKLSKECFLSILYLLQNKWDFWAKNVFHTNWHYYSIFRMIFPNWSYCWTHAPNPLQNETQFSKELWPKIPTQWPQARWCWIWEPISAIVSIAVLFRAEESVVFRLAWSFEMPCIVNSWTECYSKGYWIFLHTSFKKNDAELI